MTKKTLILPEIYDKVNAGGPFAVVRKIYETDIDKVFDYIKVKGNLELRNIKPGSIKKKCLNLLKFFLGKITSFPIFLNVLIILLFDILKLKKYNIRNYKFIISHDIFKSFLILRFYKDIKVINIYHGQGCMYNEYHNLGGRKKNFFLKKLLNYIEAYIYKHAYKIGFPSKGTYEALISTHPELETIIDKNYNILYNSIDFSVIKTHNKEIEKYLINDGYNFVTVSSIVYAKGVDRIPSFLKGLKDKGIKFKWILIGRRNEKISPLLENNIEKYNLKDNVYIYDTGGIPKSDIYGLLSKTDFYILFHRYSIFDLATLEAMYFGNIPILSKVGGNKEVILNNNGLLLEEDKLDNIEAFLEFIKKSDINELKKNNNNIINKYFNSENFIQKYYDLIN